MKKLIRLSLVLVATIGLASTVAGCKGGGGALSLDEYFEKYEQLDNEAENGTADLEREYDAALTSTTLNDEVRADLQEFYTKQVDVRREYVEGISKLDPPDEAQAPHDASVSSYEAVLTAFTGIIDDIGEAETISDLETIFGGAEITAAIEAATKACVDLQQVADDNNINVNLECE
ncbi:MAG: hypothetical protein HY873_11600 [Chloroflexi bacterium]|nr:hypothetical protein [Chloroflexota bacterium]